MTHGIKTEFTTYLAKETNGTIASGTNFDPKRVAENSIAGTVEKLESEVKLPNTRIPATPETGTESSSGTIRTEWNVDEQDDMLASVMCSKWKDETLTAEEEAAGIESRKTLVLDDEPTRSVYQMIKKYAQAPVEFQLFKGIQFNNLSIEMALNSFVKMNWDILGGNHPQSTTTDPVLSMTGVSYGTPLTTKSFKTLEGYIKYGDSFENLSPLRQVPNFKLAINNNKERTDALFETEAIEMSDGDFNVSGNIDVWKSGDVARTLSNAGIAGQEKCFEIQVSRQYAVGNVTKQTSYTIQLKVHLDDSQESKDGNKLKNTIPYTMNKADGIKFIKEVKVIEA